MINFSRPRNFLEKLSNLGTEQEKDYVELLKTRMLNQQAMITASLCFFFVLRGIDEQHVFVPLGALMCTIIILGLNHFQFRQLARLFAMLVFPVILISTTYFYGDELRMEYVYVHFILIILILFDSIVMKLVTITVVLAAFVLSLKLSESVVSPYASVIRWYDKILVFGVGVLCTANLVIIVFGGMKAFLDKTEKASKDLAVANDELKEKANQLQASNEQLHQYAQLVSHDLKTPLRSISGFASLLTRKVKQEFKSDAAVEKDLETYSEFISEGVKQMNRTIEDLLEQRK